MKARVEWPDASFSYFRALHLQGSYLLRRHFRCDLRRSGRDKVYSTLNSSTDTMTSALPNNLPPGKTLETAIRAALAEEEKLYHHLNDQVLAGERRLDHAKLSINGLNSAMRVTRVVLDSSARVVSVLSSFVDNISSVISMHGSDRIFGDLKQSLPSTDTAKRSWEAVADIVDTLLVQIESLKSTTSSHTECMRTELEAHKTIEQQSQISLDSVGQWIDALAYSMDQKRSILHPIRRVPTEVLERIFELATLDERSTLQANINHRIAFHYSKTAVYHTILRIPTILASTCRRWRMIALDMALLWSFLRVPTLERYRLSVSPLVFSTCVVGLATFQRAKSCIGASECEVVVGPTNDWSMAIEHLGSIPRSQISTMNIILPADSLDFSQIPTARVFRITGRYNYSPSVILPPLSYFLPTSVLADTRDLNCHHAVPAVIEPILSVTSFSLSLYYQSRFPDLVQPLANFPNLTALVLSLKFDDISRQDTFTPLHHARITTLSITDTVIPHLCASLQRGALSLPSLTHFILLDIIPSYSRGEWSQLQSLFVNVTCFDIRAATQKNCGSNIRQLLDVMPLLQQFSVFGNAVNGGLGALLIAPIKRIGKLVISDSKTDGSNVKSYYDALGSESPDRTDDNSGASIRFVNCPYVLSHIRTAFLVDQ